MCPHKKKTASSDRTKLGTEANWGTMKCPSQDLTLQVRSEGQAGHSHVMGAQTSLEQGSLL